MTVVATAEDLAGVPLAHHGVQAYAYLDALGAVVLLTESAAAARVGPSAPASDVGYVETPELIGREVAP